MLHYPLVGVTATYEWHLHIVVQNDMHYNKLLLTAQYDYVVCQSVTHDPTPSEQTMTHLQLHYPGTCYRHLTHSRACAIIARTPPAHVISI